MPLRFPRTWADVRKAPWLDFIEPALEGDPAFIHVRMDWLPPGFEVDHACSAVGATLSDALLALRADIWPHLRPPGGEADRPAPGAPGTLGPAILREMLEGRGRQPSREKVARHRLRKAGKLPPIPDCVECGRQVRSAVTGQLCRQCWRRSPEGRAVEAERKRKARALM
jgi:hypothetical protein